MWGLGLDVNSTHPIFVTEGVVQVAERGERGFWKSLEVAMKSIQPGLIHSI